MNVAKTENMVLRAYKKLNELLHDKDIDHSPIDVGSSNVLYLMLEEMVSVIRKHPSLMGNILKGEGIGRAKKKLGVSSIYQPSEHTCFTQLINSFKENKDRIELLSQPGKGVLQKITLTPENYRIAEYDWNLLFEVPSKLDSSLIFHLEIPDCFEVGDVQTLQTHPKRFHTTTWFVSEDVSLYEIDTLGQHLGSILENNPKDIVLHVLADPEFFVAEKTMDSGTASGREETTDNGSDEMLQEGDQNTNKHNDLHGAIDTTYERILMTLISNINLKPNMGPPTRIRQDLSDVYFLLTNYPGAITNLIKESGGMDVYTLPVFKYNLNRLKQIGDTLINSKHLSPNIVKSIASDRDMFNYAKQLEVIYSSIDRKQAAKPLTPTEQFGLVGVNVVDWTGVDRDQNEETERYHLVTSSFDHDGMLLDMHYYVEVTPEEAKLLDRNYWLTRDEAIRRLSKFHEQLRSLNGGDTPTHRFRGPNFIHYSENKTADLVLTDHDATKLTLSEAVGSKSKLLIDIYEEHFGMDMIVATTNDETYYCKTINIVNSDSVNIIGFDDILSVIPDNVDCSFGKRTLYGFESEPVELTPKQFYRKMIELNK
tara:strand:- start:308 stop:2092 length:1785 start_codon:yes stop_codon:yes gene_type:complete